MNIATLDPSVIGNSLDWLNSSEAQPAATETNEPAKTEPADTTEVTAPVEPTTNGNEAPSETPADDTSQVPLKIVADLGGEDVARQFIPLVRALHDVKASPEEVGGRIHKALQEILTPAQYAQLSWEQYSKYGKMMVETFLSEEPDLELLQQYGFVKAEPSEPAENVEDIDDDDLSPRERAREERLRKLEAENAAFKAAQQASQKETSVQSEQQIRASAEESMFGTVVNDVFSKLPDWTEAESKEAVRHAFALFNQDPEAVKQYEVGLEYERTKKPVMAVGQSKAKVAFQQYLAKGIKLVDLDRASRIASGKKPVPPPRTEIATTTPASNTANQSANGDVNPFDINKLTTAINERLRAKAAV